MVFLSKLEAPNSNISDLTGLELATNLTFLHLGYMVGFPRNSNNISDFSPLSNLTKLRTLDLAGTGISDITLLSNLTSLTLLNLGSNAISDIAPLSGLTSLERLYLYNTSISDLSVLSRLTSLRSLSLSSNNISDVSTLSSLTNLRLLRLYNNITDIAPLVANTGLDRERRYAMKYVMTLIFLLLPAWVHAAPTASDCDFNNSGKVDFADFIAFSQGYGTNQTQFDLNGDGAVNFRDFVIFVQFYGQTTTAPTLPPTTNAPVGIEVGMQAPDFTLGTLTGESFNLYEQRGKPVFLNFWGTWCGPCVAEMPDIQKLQNTMGDSIQIVGIGVRDTRNQEIRFITRYGYT